MESYICFHFECENILVKFTETVSADAIFQRTAELTEDGTLQDMDYQETIEAVLEDMNISNYEFIDIRTVDMEYAYEMN